MALHLEKRRQTAEFGTYRESFESVWKKRRKAATRPLRYLGGKRKVPAFEQTQNCGCGFRCNCLPYPRSLRVMSITDLTPGKRAR